MKGRDTTRCAPSHMPTPLGASLAPELIHWLIIMPVHKWASNHMVPLALALQLPSTALIRVLEQGSCAVPAATGQCLSSEQVPNGSGVESHCLYHSHARRGTRISPQPLSVGLDPLMVTREQSHYMPTIVGRHPSRALL